MKQAKKQTGKGHTLYEFDLPKSGRDIWILISESCYEISKTLLAENSYAEEIYFSVSGYDFDSRRGGFGIRPDGHLRYPMEIYKALQQDPRTHQLIRELFHDIRRVQVRASCAPYVVPLFHEEPDNTTFQLLEKIRLKCHLPDVIGLGLEGMRKLRIRTYTPKRSDEIQRAYRLLSLKPELLKLLRKISERSMAYWHRNY